MAVVALATGDGRLRADGASSVALSCYVILSAEIIVIALGTVQGSSLGLQIAVVAGIALLMTIGVYGLVGLIVKLDDIGLHLLRKPDASPLRRLLGRTLLVTAPRLMHLLALVGTLAMFMVGGGILVHGWPFVHHLIEGVAASLAPLAGGALLAAVAPALLNALVGVAIGLVLVLAMTLVSKLKPAK